jgi:hypothetical protein
VALPGRALPSGRVSVIAPPEVERPYDQGWEPSAERVTRYRAWTRAKQANQLGVMLTVLALATVICVVGGQPPWEPSAATLGLLALLIFVASTAVEAFWDGRGLPRRVQTAEPLPDGALEIRTPFLNALVERSSLLSAVVLGALAGAIGLLLSDDDASQTIVALIAGIGAGRIVGLELLLRLVVERADPLRTFFVSLEDDELDSPLLWRSAL